MQKYVLKSAMGMAHAMPLTGVVLVHVVSKEKTAHKRLVKTTARRRGIVFWRRGHASASRRLEEQTADLQHTMGSVH